MAFSCRREEIKRLCVGWVTSCTAVQELRQKKIPINIRRYLPDNSYEDWSVNELTIDWCGAIPSPYSARPVPRGPLEPERVLSRVLSPHLWLNAPSLQRVKSL